MMIDHKSGRANATKKKHSKMCSSLRRSSSRQIWGEYFKGVCWYVDVWNWGGVGCLFMLDIALCVSFSGPYLRHRGHLIAAGLQSARGKRSRAGPATKQCLFPCRMTKPSNLIAMGSNLIAMASNLIAWAESSMVTGYRRQSLVGWRPSLVGWRPLLLGTTIVQLRSVFPQI